MKCGLAFRARTGADVDAESVSCSRAGDAQPHPDDLCGFLTKNLLSPAMGERFSPTISITMPAISFLAVGAFRHRSSAAIPHLQPYTPNGALRSRRFILNNIFPNCAISKTLRRRTFFTAVGHPRPIPPSSPKREFRELEHTVKPSNQTPFFLYEDPWGNSKIPKTEGKGMKVVLTIAGSDSAAARGSGRSQKFRGGSECSGIGHHRPYSQNTLSQKSSPLASFVVGGPKRWRFRRCGD